MVPMGFFCVRKYINVKNGRVTPNVKKGFSEVNVKNGGRDRYALPNDTPAILTLKSS